VLLKTTMMMMMSPTNIWSDLKTFVFNVNAKKKMLKPIKKRRRRKMYKRSCCFENAMLNAAINFASKAHNVWCQQQFRSPIEFHATPKIDKQYGGVAFMTLLLYCRAINVYDLEYPRILIEN